MFSFHFLQGGPGVLSQAMGHEGLQGFGEIALLSKLGCPLYIFGLLRLFPFSLGSSPPPFLGSSLRNLYSLLPQSALFSLSPPSEALSYLLDPGGCLPGGALTGGDDDPGEYVGEEPVGFVPWGVCNLLPNISKAPCELSTD